MTDTESIDVSAEISAKILEAIPQRPPFRFVDEILELSAGHVVGAYRYREDESFYAGHFPGNPVTPGVILIETMAQIGCISLAIYLLDFDVEGKTSVFSSADVEFLAIVRPGERVIVKGEKVYFRMGAIKVNVRMERENGETVCTGVLTGMMKKIGSPNL